MRWTKVIKDRVIQNVNRILLFSWFTLFAFSFPSFLSWISGMGNHFLSLINICCMIPSSAFPSSSYPILLLYHLSSSPHHLTFHHFFFALSKFIQAFFHDDQEYWWEDEKMILFRVHIVTLCTPSVASFLASTFASISRCHSLVKGMQKIDQEM